MKTLIVFCALFIVAANASTHKTADELIAHGEALLKSSHQILDEHRNASRGHLLSAMTLEVHGLEKAIQDLKKLVAQETPNEAELHHLEATIKYRESQLNEEIHFIEDVYKNFKPSGATANELLQYGTRLMAETKKVLAKHHGQISPELSAIHAEVFQIIQLTNALRHHPADAKTAVEEEQLVKHERTLKRLIDRVEGHW